MKKLFLLQILLCLATACAEGQGMPTLQLHFVGRSGGPCTQPCPRRAIVFVHGLWGAEDTWKNPETKKTWPELMAGDASFADYDFFLADYPTSLGFGALGNRVRFTPVAQSLNQELQSTVVPYYRSVHLIGHSMGGNMILTSLLFLKFRYPNAHEILNKYLNIILLGTPVEGADIANLAWLVSNDEKLIALKPVVENELPVLIELALQNIDAKREAIGLPQLLISAGYENKPYLHSLIIVNSRSATAVASLSAPDTEKGFDRDHVSLVKPKDTNDPVYVWVKEQIHNGVARGHEPQ